MTDLGDSRPTRSATAAPGSYADARTPKASRGLAARGRRATADEVGRVGGVLRRQACQRGLSGFSLAVGLCALIWIVSVGDRGHAGQQWITTCCTERDGYPLGIWLLRLPGSLVAPAPGLPVWGSLVQILVVVGLAEAALGRALTVYVALAGHLLSTVAARGLLMLGPGVFGGLPPIDRFVLDTGPSAATVALTAYVVVVLRCPILGTLASAGLGVAMLGHSDLAGREHLAAWLVGLSCGAIQLAVLRRRASRASVSDVNPATASLVEPSAL